MKTIILTICLIALPITAAAHHSFSAVFEADRIIELEGEVTEVLWRNPHIHYTVRTNGGDVWDLESNSVSLVSRMDISADVIQAGQRVRFAGRPARSGENVMFALHALLPGGQEVVFARDRGPRWTDDVIGNKKTWAARKGDGSRPDLGIFRVWSTSFADPHSFPLIPNDPSRYPLTPAAEAAIEAFDPVTDAPWTSNCAPQGMPTIMNSPYPYEFVDKGDTILLRQEAYETVRTIHMGETAAGDKGEPSLLGHSVGRWEGETLVVTTTHIDWDYFDQVGTPLSDDAELVERFTPSEDGSRLDYEITVTDPATFTEPMVLEKHFIWLPDAKIQPYECIS